MPIFLVERYLADIERPELSSLPARLEAAAAQLRERGVEITYLDSTFLPDDECCFLPVRRIVAARDRAGQPARRTPLLADQRRGDAEPLLTLEGPERKPPA
jgi:hypothetical protein